MIQLFNPEICRRNNCDRLQFGFCYGILRKCKINKEAVRRYINEQQGKDVFEYNVFGSSDQKIGDFTQTKLEGFA